MQALAIMLVNNNVKDPRHFSVYHDNSIYEAAFFYPNLTGRVSGQSMPSPPLVAWYYHCNHVGFRVLSFRPQYRDSWTHLVIHWEWQNCEAHTIAVPFFQLFPCLPTFVLLLIDHPNRPNASYTEDRQIKRTTELHIITGSSTQVIYSRVLNISVARQTPCKIPSPQPISIHPRRGAPHLG
jgi:hypothetical protein